jgi:hypothetical protein
MADVDTEDGAVIHCFNGMLLIVTLPVWVMIGVLYSPYYVYKGISALVKSCGTSSAVSLP